MIDIYVSDKLIKDIEKRLNKSDADKVFKLFFSLEKEPYKGDILSSIGDTLIKELKHNSFRFYFILKGNTLKIMNREGLTNEIIKFIGMSKKGKEQQRVIDRVKKELINNGFNFF